MKKTKGVLKFIMLGIIIAYRRIHGYGIHKEITKISDGKWAPSIGTTYRLLSELERDGYVVKKAVRRGRRRIIIYTPTEKGLSEFIRIADLFLDKINISLKLLLKITREYTPNDHRGIEVIRRKILELKALLNSEE